MTKSEPPDWVAERAEGSMQETFEELLDVARRDVKSAREKLERKFELHDYRSHGSRPPNFVVARPSVYREGSYVRFQLEGERIVVSQRLDGGAEDALFTVTRQWDRKYRKHFLQIEGENDTMGEHWQVSQRVLGPFFFDENWA